MCPIAFILEEPNQGRFVHREGKAGRFTYEKQSGRASMHRARAISAAVPSLPAVSNIWKSRPLAQRHE